MQELIDSMKGDEEEAPENVDKTDEETDAKDLPHTRKYTLEQVEGELPKVITNSFDYHQYSTADESNDRFLEKQKKQNSLRGTLFEQVAEGKGGSYMSTPTTESQDLFEQKAS